MRDLTLRQSTAKLHEAQSDWAVLKHEYGWLDMGHKSLPDGTYAQLPGHSGNGPLGPQRYRLSRKGKGNEAGRGGRT